MKKYIALRKIHRHTHTEIHTYMHTYRQTDRQTDRHTYRHASIRSCTRCTCIYTYTHIRTPRHACMPVLCFWYPSYDNWMDMRYQACNCSPAHKRTTCTVAYTSNDRNERARERQNRFGCDICSRHDEHA